MAPENVLDRTPNVLSRDQQESYFANGYLLIERAIDSSVLEKLRAATAQAINASRTVSISDATWDLETGHTADEPKLRRLTSPNDYDDTYWKYASSPALSRILTDLIGPNISSITPN